jgi:YD repeat-containing protein
MKGYITFCFLLIQVIGSSQLTRREIIEKKILSVERTTYNKAGTKMNAQKNYYSRYGADSLELSNGETQYRFKPELDDKGRVSQLTRFDTRGKSDETHAFEYNKDGYTIEVSTPEGGVLYRNSYNNEHDRLIEVQSSTDTFYYSNNDLGKVAKISQKDAGVMKDVVVTEFDAKGLPVVMRIVDGSGYFTRLVYNDQGLPAEVKRMKSNNSEEQLVLKTVYTYEFRKN